jgi:hypothetical protein
MAEIVQADAEAFREFAERTAFAILPPGQPTYLSNTIIVPALVRPSGTRYERGRQRQTRMNATRPPRT